MDVSDVMGEPFDGEFVSVVQEVLSQTNEEKYCGAAKNVLEVLQSSNTFTTRAFYVPLSAMLKSSDTDVCYIGICLAHDIIADPALANVSALSAYCSLWEERLREVLSINGVNENEKRTAGTAPSRYCLGVELSVKAKNECLYISALIAMYFIGRNAALPLSSSSMEKETSFIKHVLSTLFASVWYQLVVRAKCDAAAVRFRYRLESLILKAECQQLLSDGMVQYVIELCKGGSLDDILKLTQAFVDIPGPDALQYCISQPASLLPQLMTRSIVATKDLQEYNFFLNSLNSM